MALRALRELARHVEGDVEDVLVVVGEAGGEHRVADLGAVQIELD